MKFDAAERVKPLEYDLTAFQPNPDAPGITDEERERRRQVNTLPEWAGFISEPSEDALVEYQDALTQAQLAQLVADEKVTNRHRVENLARWREAHPEEDPDVTPSDRTVDAWLGAEQLKANVLELQQARTIARREVRDDLNRACAEFCNGTPSEAVLAEIPWRGINLFTGWLSGQFSPETLAAATNE